MLYLYLLHSKRRRMRIGSSGNAIENLGETKIRPNPPPHFGTVQIFPSKYNEEDYLPNSAQTQILPLSDEAGANIANIWYPCFSYWSVQWQWIGINRMTYNDHTVFQLQGRKFSQLLTGWAVLKTDQTQFCGRMFSNAVHDFPQNCSQYRRYDFLSYMIFSHTEDMIFSVIWGIVCRIFHSTEFLI